MRKTKRIISFLITFSLLLSMAPFAFATETTTELTEVTSLPIALDYDSDLIVTTGNSLNPDTYMGGEAAAAFIKGSYTLEPTLNTTAYDVIISEATDDDGNTTYTTETRYTVKTPANNLFGPFHYSTETLENDLNNNTSLVNLGVTFDIPAGGEAGSVNDSIIRYGSQDEKTLKASGRPQNRIYFVHVSNTKHSLPVTFQYTDGTTASKTLQSHAGYKDYISTVTNYVTRKGTTSWILKMNDEEKAEPVLTYSTENKYYLADGAKSGATKAFAIPDGNGGYKTTTWHAFNGGVGVSYIEVDEGKVVDEIILGSPSSNLIAIFAASEGLLTNAELQAAADFSDTEAYPNGVASATDDEIKYAKACIEELTTYRNDATDYSAIIDEYNNRKLYLTEETEYHIPIPCNNDTIAYGGETLDSTLWHNLIDGSNYQIGFYAGSSNFTSGTVLSADGIGFDFVGLEGGVADSIARFRSDKANKQCEVDPVTVNSSGRPASTVYFVYESNGSGTKLPVTINYADGTSSETISLALPGYQYATTANGYTTYKRYGMNGANVYNSDGVAVYDSAWSETFGIVVAPLDIPADKIVESYTLGTVTGADAVILAMSEKLLSNSELLTTITDLSTDDKVVYAKACADELVLRGGDASYYQEVYDAYADLEYALSGDTSEFYYADLTFDADLIAKVDDTAGDNWLGGVATTDRFRGINGESVSVEDNLFTIGSYRDYTNASIVYDTDGNATGYINNDGTTQELTTTTTKDDGTTSTSNNKPSYTSVSATIPFKVNPATFSGAVNDSVDLGESKKIELSGRPLSQLWFMISAGGAYKVLELDVTYTDGTAGTLKICSAPAYTMQYLDAGVNYVKSWLNNDMYGFKIYTAEKNSDTSQLVTKNDTTGKVEKYTNTTSTMRSGFSFIGKHIYGNKGIESITIPAYTGALLLAVTEVAVSEEVLTAHVEDVVENISVVTTEEQKEAVALADEYVDELLARHIYKETSDNYVAVKRLAEQVELSNVIYTDLSDHYNADAIGYVNDQVGTSWFGGYEYQNTFAPFNAEKISNSDGVISAVEYTGGGSGTTDDPYTFTATGDTISAKLSGLSGGKDDSVKFTDPITIKLSGRTLDKIYFATSSYGDWNNLVTGTFNYSDGTTEDFAIAPFTFYGADYYKDKSVTGDSNNLMQDYNDYTGFVKLNQSSVKPNDDNVLEAYSTSNSAYIGIHIIGKELADKAVDSVTLNKPSTKAFLLHAITEVPLATEELIAHVEDVVKNISVVTTAEDKAAVALASEYVDELVVRLIYTTESENYVKIKALESQIAAGEQVYIDLSVTGLNADVIVPNGSSILKEEYKGRDAEYEYEDETTKLIGGTNRNLYNASVIPEDGIITMDAPTGKTIDEAPNAVPGYDGRTLTDATFRLSGNYKGFGEDAILVDTDDVGGVTIEFADDEQRKYSDMYFLLDAPYGEQVLTNQVRVKINFADGTSLDAKSRLHYNRSYYNPDIYAYKGYGVNPLVLTEGTDANGDTILTTSRDSSGDTFKFFASGLIQNKIETTKTSTDETTGETTETTTVTFEDIEIPYKDVVSVTFMPNSKGNYTILAVTAIPYTVDELDAAYWNGVDAYDDGVIVGENDDIIKKGAEAGIELYEVRKVYDRISEADYKVALEMLEAVENARQLYDAGFNTELSISIADGKVNGTAVITNGMVDGKDVVLVIAAYGKNNKLLAINTTEVETFVKGAYKEIRAVDCDEVEDAEYYALFAWESLEGLRPIAYTTLDAE